MLAGGTLTYSLTAQNNGPSGATGVTLTDTLPAGVDLPVRDASQGSCAEASGTVTCDLGTLANGSSATVQIAVTAQSEGTITNTATVVGAESDPVTPNNAATTDTDRHPRRRPRPHQVRLARPGAGRRGARLHPDDPQRWPLGRDRRDREDNLPAGVAYASATSSQGTCSETGGTVSCALGSIVSGSSATVLIHVAPQATGTITNSASAQANETDPVPANNSATEGTTVVSNGYARPKGASPSTFRLVPAYEQCNNANAMHDGGLNVPSCNPPVPSSNLLTLGSPDANGRAANSTGQVTFRVVGESPINLGNGDQADVNITAQLTDVRLSSDLSDYTGELEALIGLRITDRLNGPTGTTPATIIDAPLRFVFACAPTAADIGGECNVTTSLDTITPGLITEGKRAVWQLAGLNVYDGGPDGDADTADNTLFAVEGLFAP